MYGGVGPELRFGDRKDSDLVSLEYSSFFQFEKEPHHKQQTHCHPKPQVICVWKDKYLTTCIYFVSQIWFGFVGKCEI